MAGGGFPFMIIYALCLQLLLGCLAALIDAYKIKA